MDGYGYSYKEFSRNTDLYFVCRCFDCRLIYTRIRCLGHFPKFIYSLFRCVRIASALWHVVAALPEYKEGREGFYGPHALGTFFAFSPIKARGATWRHENNIHQKVQYILRIGRGSPFSRNWLHCIPRFPVASFPLPTSVFPLSLPPPDGGWYTRPPPSLSPFHIFRAAVHGRERERGRRPHLSPTAWKFSSWLSPSRKPISS